ncbi:MAG: Chemotaxis response regulator protein-glutamate methylesterase [Gammaproteobacteria bacterium]|nr:Chemotaxis response regulator protein-glutamate methylesterase [Gammaproteobacteria bacterium]
MDVFIADDSRLVRERLASMLADVDGVRVVGEAGDIHGAVAGILSLQPQTLILDVELPGGTGIDVLKAIAGVEPMPRVIMLTNNPQPAYREKCRRAGAEFFFDKTLEFEKVAQVLRVLRATAPANGEAATADLPRNVYSRLDADWARHPAAASGPSLALASTTDTAVMLARQIADCPHANLRLEPASVFWTGAAAPRAEESLLYASLCRRALGEGGLLVIDDVERDRETHAGLLACGQGPMRFFAAAPVVLADGVAAGVLTVLDAEPRILTAAQRAAMMGLARQIADGLELQRVRQQTEAMSVMAARAPTRDALTGLQNRAALQESMMRGIAHASRNAEKLAFLYIDIDNFRRVNQACGRETGDAMLVETGKRLLASVRGADTVARLGGDEFAVLVQGLHGAEDAVVIAKKLHRTLSIPFTTRGHRWSASCSIGVSVYPNDGPDGDALLRHADTAMCGAKSRGRGGYQLFAGGERRG